MSTHYGITKNKGKTKLKYAEIQQRHSRYIFYLWYKPVYFERLIFGFYGLNYANSIRLWITFENKFGIIKVIKVYRIENFGTLEWIRNLNFKAFMWHSSNRKNDLSKLGANLQNLKKNTIPNCNSALRYCVVSLKTTYFKVSTSPVLLFI